MTKAKLTRIPKRVLACVLAVLMVLSCLTMLPFTGFADNENHAKLESPAVVQGDNGTYYAFGSGNVLYESSDMANWGTAPVEGGYITDDGIGNIIETYERRLDKTIGKTDLSSPEVVKIGDTWYLYISVMSGNTSMILRAPSTEGDANGPYAAFEPVLETGFKRSAADSVLQDYIQKSYNNNAPTLVSEWGKGTCYYYSNFLGLNYQWYTEELPRAYAPSIAQDDEGNYWMAYGYRDGGIWMQKLHKDGENAGLIDFTWSGNNYAALGGWQTSPYQYIPEEHYNTANVDDARLDPYFGELLVHTTEGGDTDTLESSVSRAGEEPELYFVGDQAYLQVTYGGPNNSDGYNVRSYKNDGEYHPNGTTDTWNFADMNGESGVDNADASMIGNENSVKRTGLKLMGDYGMPGTAENTYYTSPGASSVSTGEDGLTFYNYQVKTNDAVTGEPVVTDAEMRSHILLHSAAGDPLVTPFEYTGSGDAKLYNAAYGESSVQYDIDNDIVGQYYVTMTGNETSGSVQTNGGITLTSGGIVSGMISGSWDFEETDHDKTNLIVIHDEKNDIDYHGALLMQTVESVDSLGSSKPGTQQMTFTLTGGNQTVWGVWYGKYEPAGENNAAAGLEVSPAIYTGGALALNAVTNGQLGLKYGNYITAFKFAEIDYTTYMMIDDRYEIRDVYDYYENSGSSYDGNDFIVPYEVTDDLLNCSDFASSELAQAVYTNREVDPIEKAKDGADNVDQGDNPGTRTASIDELKSALRDKLDEAKGQNKRLYVLTGYLESNVYGRDHYTTNDKGDITLMVKYIDTLNDSNDEFSERVYSHVYQQPVSANVSGSIYFSDYRGIFDDKPAAPGGNGDYHWTSSAFMRAEGSYSADSYFYGTSSDAGNIRNSNIRESLGGKKLAVRGIYNWYNPTLQGDSPQYWPGDNDWFHDEYTSILVDDGGIKFNGGDNSIDGVSYRMNENFNLDIAASYEQTINDVDESGYHHAVAGPRANYYVDKSSYDTSNIAAYIADDGSISIPLYYSNIPVNRDNAQNTSWFVSFNKTFNYGDNRYMAGLYAADRYGATSSNTSVGQEYLDEDPNYDFTVDFHQVDEAYNSANRVFINVNQSDSAYIFVNTNLNTLSNDAQSYVSTDDITDYNFYIRTKTESDHSSGANYDGDEHRLRMVEDMEYGVYVTDKSYLRDYYNSVMEDKLAQDYTYYSWETFRDATRLIADYLNNYMQLADMYHDRAGEDAYDAVADYAAQVQAGYLEKLEEYGGLQTVLTDETAFNKMLSTYPEDTQGVLCFLLTEAENQLFSYDTYQNFKDAYSRFDMMLKQMNNYTTSSWKAYLNETIGNSITLDDGTIITFKALNAYLPEHNDKVTDTALIYDPRAEGDQTDKNYSWKVIYDGYLGGDAAAVFEQATEILEHAASILQRKADYDALDAQMEIAGTKCEDRVALKGSETPGTLDGETVSTEKDAIFNIDRSTVNAIANSNSEVQGDGNDEINGQQYTVSSLAAFDKIYDAIWEIKTDTTTDSDENDYLNDTSIENAVLTDRSAFVDESGEFPDKWYSDKVRDDQQYFMTQRPGTGEMLSTVQQKINDRVTWVQRALEWLEPVALKDQYQTFDYLIDVISTIDFNAYTPEGQQLLWDKLYELLVEGGVYAVNQQLFSKTSMDENKLDPTDPLTQILYNNGQGEDTYYTGWNATNVDAATTELMTLLNTLEKKTYDVTFTVHYKKLDGTDADPATVKVDTEPKTYGDSLTLNIPGFNGSQMYAYSWVVTTNPGQENELVQNLSNMGGTYTYTANNPANIDVYVTMGMPDPSYNPQAEGYTPVTVRRNLGGERNELAMSLTDEQLAKYTVEVNGDTLTFKDGGGQTITTVTAGLVPFHEFTGWKTISGKGVQFADDDTTRTFYLKDLLYGSAEITITPTYIITGHEYQVYVNNSEAPILLGGVAFNTLVTIGSEQTVDNLGGTFYAWLIKEGSSYKIASYAQDYSFHVGSGDVEIVQVNVSEDGKTYYLNDIYGLNGDKGSVVTLDSSTMYVDKDDIKEIDTDSLYYRLSNKLRDSWSTNSEFDETSRKIALYSSYTDASQAEGKGVAEVAECGALFVRVKGEVTDPSAFANRLVVDAAGVQKFVSGSQTNTDQQEGQYTITVHFADDTDYSDTDALMRSYVTYKYTFTNENGETSEVFRTAYSDVKAIDLAKATIQTGGDNA